jgi:small subunit ribosomal protein S1
MKMEDIHIEDSENFAELFAKSEQKTKKNAIMKGTIVELNDTYALVDVGQKSEGKLNISEITKDGVLQYAINDEIEIILMQNNGERPMISHKNVIQRKLVGEFFKAHGAEPENLLVEGTVVAVKQRAGFTVQDKDGLEYFMPMAQGYLKVQDAMGKKVKAIVLNVKPDSNSIVISKKKYIENYNIKREENIAKLLEDNSPRNGIVKKITNYGVFVEVEGIDGLVSYKDISHRGPVNPIKYFNQDEEVLVVVKNYDKETRKLSFSIKDAQSDPWDELEDSIAVGDVISVYVNSFESYGAFVNIGNDIEGLLHISEISWDNYTKTPKEHLEIGQNINVEIIDIDSVKKRLRVSLKRLQPKPFDTFKETHKIGDVINGTVATLTEFGAFVNIGNVDGLIHNEEASWDNSVKCKDIYKKGDEVEVKIIKIDSQKENISLSVKALGDSPTAEFKKDNKIGDIVVGKIKNIKDFGIFVSLSDKIDGLIRTEDLVKNENDELTLNVDDEITAVLVEIDVNKNKVRLSEKKLEHKRQQEVLNSINDTDRMTLGDALKGKF